MAVNVTCVIYLARNNGRSKVEYVINLVTRYGDVWCSDMFHVSPISALDGDALVRI